MGMEVTGLVRNPPAEADRIHGVTYFTADDVTAMLGSCDYVCNVLPSTAYASTSACVSAVPPAFDGHRTDIPSVPTFRNLYQLVAC